MNLTPGNERDQRKVIPLVRSGDYFFRCGIKAYRRNRLQRAIKLFERAVKLTSTEPVFQVQLAAVLSEIGEYERSNTILQQVLVEQGDEIAECYFFIANNYAYLGLFEKAEKAALRYLELQPNDRFSQDAHELLELLHFEFEEEDWDELDLDEDELISHHERARYLLKKGEVEAAIPLLESLLDEHPTCWAAKNHLAEAFFRRGDEIAFTICEEILAEDEGNLFAICNLALFYSKKGEATKAKSYIEALKNVYPLDADHYIKVAETLCAVGEYEHAYERLKRLNRTEFEGRPVLLYCIGIALIHLNNHEQAMQYITRAAHLNDQQALAFSKMAKDGFQVNEAIYNIWSE